MSYLKIIFNRKAIRFLIYAGAFLITAILMGYFYQPSKNTEKNFLSFKSEINNYKDLIDSYLIDLSKLDETQLYKISDDKWLKNSNVTILVYDQTSLVFWSDNSVPLDLKFNSELFEKDYLMLENGLYLRRTHDANSKRYVGLLLIKKAHGFENEYLKNRFNSIFKLPGGTRLSFQSSEYTVKNANGEFAFSLIIEPERRATEALSLILLLTYLISLVFIIRALHQMYRGLNTILAVPKLLFIFFVADVAILRAVLFYFSIPEILYGSKLFGPSYLAISSVIPSLGDLVINSAIVLMLAWYFYNSFNFGFRNELPIFKRVFIGFSLIFHVYIFFFLYQLIFKKIVFDSVISFNLENVFSLSVQSLLGFLSITALILSFVLISVKLSIAARSLFPGFLQFLSVLILTSGIVVLLGAIRNEIHLLSVTAIILFLILVSTNSTSRKTVFSFTRILILLFGFALFTSYSLQQLNRAKEEQQRMLIAIDLATNRDKITEYRFKDLAERIKSDEELYSKVLEAYYQPALERMAEDYVINKYFDKFWAKYDVLVTLCYPGKELKISPGDFIVDCRNYFEGYITELGEPTDYEYLFHLLPGINYLARVELGTANATENHQLTLFIEINSKAVSKGLGYPELLIDNATRKSNELYNYSYAMYLNGELVRSVGRYPYTLTDDVFPDNPGLFSFFEFNKFRHLQYNAGPNTKLIVSLPIPGFLEIVAPFSYLVIFFSFFLMLFIVITGKGLSRPFYVISFRNRIQYSIFGIVLMSFLTIGVSSLYNISRLNHNKNISVLNEKNHSVLIELEHKLSDYDELGNENKDYLETLLAKFSMVFFSDINVYDPQGILLASSRPQIFEEGLISNRMNAQAYRQLSIERKSAFIHSESIGEYNYLSAYLPFLNDRNKLMGFVNLPYFARQSELRQEISTFLIAFTNIYVVLMAIGLSLALLLSDYLLRPLMLLKANLKRVKLSESTHKIDWKGNDEISELISEYNRMTEELVKSAELLARSERESAWREMAKQVAHEIKNPLTPMKLSVQYLEKAWKDKASDWDERLNRFVQTLIQQIESLSEIASAFSDFASMPAATHERVDLNEVIRDATGLFKDNENIDIRINIPSDQKELFVFADRRQLLRVFNNLIQNSIQAIGNSPKGIIQIDLLTEDEYCLVKVTDNGSGITPEQQERIFSPYFTTKTSGTGLGLAIVKNIISGVGGQISFTSVQNQGTTFSIKLPLAHALS